MNPNDNDNSNLCSDEALLRFMVPTGRRSPALNAYQMHADVRGNCPDSDQYVRLFLGTSSAHDSENLLSHAAECDRCGQLLAGSMAVFEGNTSQEETDAIAELAAHKEWQRDLANTLANTPVRRPGGIPVHRSRRTFFLVISGVAASLAAVASIWMWQTQRNMPEHQLALAYTRARTIELRIPNARFAEFSPGSHTRGTLDVHESSPLLEARAKLARELESNPQNAHWLDLQARADLLEEHYDSAVQVLDRLIAVGPVTAELLTDAGSAYYQRGLVSSSETDRSTALDYLRRADTMAPTDPVILFNEAIVMEDRGQMMNAVEVWNRYVTVERDETWKAEGKRKLAALEQTLNRLKTHQSRLMQMLATPQAMDALSSDPQKLAAWDEELTSMELDKLIPIAFPVPSVSRGIEQARGSPPTDCLAPCSAARRLLKALALSLEHRHHDSWLTDLLPPDYNSFTSPSAETYAEAMRLLAQATREDQNGLPTTGVTLARKGGKLFHALLSSASAAPWLASAARVGELRSNVEYMFALQRTLDYKGCRAFALTFREHPSAKIRLTRYPWMDSVAAMTQKVCDDTAVTSSEGSVLIKHAMTVAQLNHYQYLVSRARMRELEIALNSGDIESAEATTLAVLRGLESGDPPLIRITNTIPEMSYCEDESPRFYLQELMQRENLAWFELAQNKILATTERLTLVRTELQLGNVAESKNLLRTAEAESKVLDGLGSASTLLTETRILVARAMLENGDTAGAQQYLELTRKEMGAYSDNWGLHAFASARGLLALERGDLDLAEKVLEEQLKTSEGTMPAPGDAEAIAAQARLNHDLYAELAATWLAKGRPAEQILALWEQFRLRSRGLSTGSCSAEELDCVRGKLTSAQHGLGDSAVIGQIVLLDRVLLYRMDLSGIHWTQKFGRRQDLLKAVSILQRAVTSSTTTLSFAEQLGSKVTGSVLPTLPSTLATGATLFLEPDPDLEDLPWPVLPTPTGALGIAYPIAELRSILATSEKPQAPNAGENHELIVGASVSSPGAPPLPEALDEARIVGRYADAPELLLGNRATARQVASVIESATLFHFAGHATTSGRGTELMLASSSSEDRSPWIDNTFLRLHPPRACRLAVLSACATGKQQASGTSPLGDMVETLQSLGVSDVVATRWQLDSKAAVPFIETFYSHLARGSNVAMALSDARRLQSSQPTANTPYYWAAYYVAEQGKSRSERGPHGKSQNSAKDN